MATDAAGVRGQFYTPTFVQLDARVFQYLSGKAQNKGLAVETLVNDLLKKAIELAWRLE